MMYSTIRMETIKKQSKCLRFVFAVRVLSANTNTFFIALHFVETLYVALDSDGK